MKLGNYTPDYMESAMSTEGSVDTWNLDKASLATETEVKDQRTIGSVTVGAKRQYEFILIPNIGFLSSPDLLLKDCQLKLRFTRNDPNIAFINITDDAKLDVLEITNFTATSEFISSSPLRSHLRNDTKPFLYKYEDVEVKIFSLPDNVTNWRVDNVYGGNLPLYIFAGLIDTERLQGHTHLASTKFRDHNVEELNIMVNGVAVNGYPIKLINGSPVKAFHKFLDTTDNLCSVEASQSLKMNQFIDNFLWSHKFEAEGAEGSISISGRMSSTYGKPMSLVVWTVYPYAVSLDKYNQVEKMHL